ncbi:hypothetical protein Tco_0618054 [Tanacetum coccineum]
MRDGDEDEDEKNDDVNYDRLQSNKDLALNEQPDGAAVESKSNDVEQTNTDLDVHAVTGCNLSTDFVLSDAKGNDIHCTAKANIAHNFLKLKECSIYLIRDFVVHPNKDEYRIFRDHAVILEFDGATSVRKTSVTGGGFVRYPFELQDLGNIELTNNKYLIDKIYLSSSSSTQILDDPHIPALKEFKKGISDGEGALDQLEASCGDSMQTSLFEYPPILNLNRIFLTRTIHSTVVVMFDDTATELVKCFADSIVQAEDETFTCGGWFPKSGEIKSVGSSNVDAKVLAKRKRVKTLAMHPSVSTPSKPVEDKKKKRVELEDSEEEMASAWNGAQENAEDGQCLPEK